MIASTVWQLIFNLQKQFTTIYRELILIKTFYLYHIFTKTHFEIFVLGNLMIKNRKQFKI